MMFLLAADPCHRIRYVHLCTGSWTLLFVLMMTVGSFASDSRLHTGPVRELRLGLAAHDVDGLWSGKSKEQGPDLCAEVILNHPLFQFISATAYPHAGISLNSQGDTSKIYGGLLLQWEPASALFFSVGLGLALHDGKRDTDSADRKSLGSRVLFRIPIEIGYAVKRHHRIILAFDHASNADLASPNEGMDTLGLVYGYRF